MARFGKEHAKTWLKYTTWKKSLKKEKTDTIRPLHLEEIAYFEYAKQYYESLPTLCPGKHKFHNPPSTWISRYLHLKQPTRYKEIIDCLVQFVKNCKECSKSERSNWNQVLEPLPLGSLERILWATAFLKSTNGVADKVSCGHFRELVKNAPALTLDLHQKPYLIAAMLRQTSKWVKNTFVLMNNSWYIETEWKGVPSEDFSDWLRFYEIWPKTGSLIFHAAYGKMMNFFCRLSRMACLSPLGMD
jgi:hypothetical protein